jgi:hypothetical protein
MRQQNCHIQLTTLDPVPHRIDPHYRCPENHGLLHAHGFLDTDNEGQSDEEQDLALLVECDSFVGAWWRIDPHYRCPENHGLLHAPAKAQGHCRFRRWYPPYVKGQRKRIRRIPAAKAAVPLSFCGRVKKTMVFWTGQFAGNIPVVGPYIQRGLEVLAGGRSNAELPV